MNNREHEFKLLNDEILQLEKDIIQDIHDIEKIERERKNLENRARALHIRMSNPSAVIQELDEQFEELTTLSKTDFIFLLFATVLQVVRQYLLTQFKPREERLNDKQAARDSQDNNSKFSDNSAERQAGWYYASLQEICLSPVPFDCIRRSSKMKDRGISAGLSGYNHRYETLGHDPILGYIFGTANILTKTLTKCNMHSYHIKSNGTQDVIHSSANTQRLFEESCKRNYIDIACALMKEHAHLKSDVDSTQGLALPFISYAINANTARKLAKYGMDVCNIRTFNAQFQLSALINLLVAMLHRLSNTQNTSEDIFACRTKKIITYSNILSTYSNVFLVSMGILDPKHVDLGGLTNTFLTAIKDINFYYRIKHEFIINSFFDNEKI